GLKGLAYIVKTSSGEATDISGTKTLSGTSMTTSFTVDLSSLAVGSYKVEIGVVDTNSQKSNYKYYWFQKELLATVNSVSPTSATSGVSTTFTVTGSNLPSTIAMSLAGSLEDSCSTPFNVTSTSAQITCTPSITGSQRFYVAKVSQGEAISGSKNLYVTVNAPDDKPTVTINTSGSSSSNNPQSSNFDISVTANDD
ncbi:hypothetical protein, partial [Desulfobacter latus]